MTIGPVPGDWNQWIYQALHAGQPSRAMIAFATILSEAPLWGALVLVAWQLPKRKAPLIRASAIVFVCLLVEATIGWLHPIARPFAAGWGPAWMLHAANNSFPSTHVALASAFGLILFCHGRGLAGWGCLACAAVMAWARIYVGIHWPLDMLGAFALAIVSTAAVEASWRLAWPRHIPNSP